MYLSLEKVNWKEASGFAYSQGQNTGTKAYKEVGSGDSTVVIEKVRMDTKRVDDRHVQTCWRLTKRYISVLFRFCIFVYSIHIFYPRMMAYLSVPVPPLTIM